MEQELELAAVIGFQGKAKNIHALKVLVLRGGLESPLAMLTNI